VIEDANSDLYLPAMVLAELVDLISKGKSPLTLAELEVALNSDARLAVLPLTGEIALSGVRFAALPDIHDRCIVATAAKLIELIPDAVLVTRDGTIRKFNLIPTLWD
jgi:predicted nucleic acid-binding protein